MCLLYFVIIFVSPSFLHPEFMLSSLSQSFGEQVLDGWMHVDIGELGYEASTITSGHLISSFFLNFGCGRLGEIS